MSKFCCIFSNLPIIQNLNDRFHMTRIQRMKEYHLFPFLPSGSNLRTSKISYLICQMSSDPWSRQSLSNHDPSCSWMGPIISQTTIFLSKTGVLLKIGRYPLKINISVYLVSTRNLDWNIVYKHFYSILHFSGFGILKQNWVICICKNKFIKGLKLMIHREFTTASRKYH